MLVDQYYNIEKPICFRLNPLTGTMVDVLGHLGMALLWLAPVWYFLVYRRTAALVVAGGFWFGMPPDIGLPLSVWVPGIHHHGVVHAVLAVAVFAVVLGPLVGFVFKRIGALTVLIPGLAHVFADMLSAPDVSMRRWLCPVPAASSLSLSGR